MSATTTQKQEITRLIRKAEFDPRTITLQHVHALNLPRNTVGTPVDVWLGKLDRADASDAITKLRNYTEE